MSIKNKGSKSLSISGKKRACRLLEKREDMALSALAEFRERSADKMVGHKDAWK